MAGLWYRSGSVAVTQSSKKVTGSGTSWLTALNRPSKGNVFYGPDGKAYEIDYISSETELYLVDAYAGAAATGQSYKIDVRGGTVPELSRQLSEHYAYMQGVIDSLQSIVSGSGDVTITGPSGQTVTVPALANMLSKSGNLAGLADKATSRRNLGISAFSDSLLDDADAAAMRTTLGLVKQSAAKDNTTGLVMLTGAGGLLGGTYNVVSDDATLAERVALGTCFTRMGTSNPENPFPGEYANVLVFPETLSAANGYSGLVVSLSSDKLAFIRKGGSVKKIRLDDNSSISLDGGTSPRSFSTTRNDGSGKTVTAELVVSSVEGYVSALLGHINGVVSNGILLTSGVDGLMYSYGGSGLPTRQKVHHNGNLPYETGTFTPTVQGGTSAGTATYVVRYGNYTRIGKRVLFELYMQWSGATGTGELRIYGLPFVNANASPGQFTVIPENLTFSGQICAGMPSAATYITLMSVVSDAMWSAVQMDGTAGVRISGVYQIP